ncbi:MAG TPA: hypothetical protein VHE08_01015 [Solirubrobacterales bacterium]|nr:hypothetical protein [Solirubrobacterales bacterium]
MEVRGEARAMFAAILLLIAGVLNVIYGIAAIGNASFFDHQTAYVVFGLGFWGWVTLLIGLVQLTGGWSLFSGGTYGRVIGIIGASIGAVESLLSIGGSYPFWSLGIFALCLIVLHGLIVYGEPVER